MRLLLILALTLAALAPASRAAEGDIARSILRVNVTSQGYSFRLPWQKESPSSQRGLGALIGDGKVLVTAEIVVNSTYIEIEKPHSGEKISAVVEGVDYEANLAVIVPEDPEAAEPFFADLQPLEVAEEVSVGDQLEVWQFEPNGTSVSTGVTVDKFDLGRYFLDSAFFLVYEAGGTLQYRDGSYNLPVLRDGKLAGMLMEYSSASQSSKILPASIIHHFLTDLAAPPYRGFPNFGIKFARTLDDQLREALDMGGRQGGIFVSAVLPGTSAEASGIEEGDVILEIGGHPVDARGNYVDEKLGTLSIAHLVKGDVYAGDIIEVKILRNGEEMAIPVTLVRKDPEKYLVPPYMFGRGPNYLIMGGMLFQELTLPFLQSAGDKWETHAPFKLVYANSHPEHYEDEGREKLVFLSGTLPSRSALGYEQLSSLIVDSVNGRKINKIQDLEAAFDAPGDDGIHEIRFTEFPTIIYLDDEAARFDNENLLPQRYRIHQLKRIE
ncbi:S1C family serine protease [soil metagenome]